MSEDSVPVLIKENLFKTLIFFETFEGEGTSKISVLPVLRF